MSESLQLDALAAQQHVRKRVVELATSYRPFRDEKLLKLVGLSRPFAFLIAISVSPIPFLLTPFQCTHTSNERYPQMYPRATAACAGLR